MYIEGLTEDDTVYMHEPDRAGHGNAAAPTRGPGSPPDAARDATADLDAFAALGFQTRRLHAVS